MGGKIYSIRIADTGEVFACGEDEFVLAAMHKARAGQIKHGCYGGGCGVCKMKVLSGQVHHAKRMSRAHVTQEEQARGYVLTCCIQPWSDLVLAMPVGGIPTEVGEHRQAINV